jgi:hypothetical protein
MYGVEVLGTSCTPNGAVGYTCVDSNLKTGSAVCVVEFTDPFKVRSKLLSFNRAPNKLRPGRTQFATADVLTGSVGDFLHT